MKKQVEYKEYQEEDITLKFVVQDDNIWTTEKDIAAYFGLNEAEVGKHLLSLKDSIVSIDILGVPFYSLHSLMAVGHRAEVHKDVQQLQTWANSTIDEHYLLSLSAFDREILENMLSMKNDDDISFPGYTQGNLFFGANYNRCYNN